MEGLLANESPVHSCSPHIKTTTKHITTTTTLLKPWGLFAWNWKMQNKHILAQAENKPLCYSKFSKSLSLKNTFKCIYFVYSAYININCVTLSKHTSYFMGFLNGSEWFSKTDWYYFYANTEVTEVTIKCYFNFTTSWR